MPQTTHGLSVGTGLHSKLQVTPDLPDRIVVPIGLQSKLGQPDSSSSAVKQGVTLDTPARLAKEPVLITVRVLYLFAGIKRKASVAALPRKLCTRAHVTLVFNTNRFIAL